MGVAVIFHFAVERRLIEWGRPERVPRAQPLLGGDSPPSR